MINTKINGHDHHSTKSRELSSLWLLCIRESLLLSTHLMNVKYLMAAEQDSYQRSSTSRPKCEANIFATSRFIPEITEKFEGSISLEIRASDEDVRRYLDGHMSQLPAFVKRSPDLQEEIKTEIIKAVEGMYVPSILL